MHRLGAGDILLAHDGHAARGTDGVPLVVAVLPALLERIRALELVPVTLPAAARTDSALGAAATP
jgi:hypothetical protein